MSGKVVDFDRIAKYCRAVSKEYELSGANSSKAAAYRQKVLSMLVSFEDDPRCNKALDIFWRIAYYKPLMELRASDDPNAGLCIQILVNVFCGEIHAQLARTKRFTSIYNLYLGDLHRYQSDCNPEKAETDMSVVYYRRAVEADPDLGQAFNQLALKAEGIAAVRYFLLALSSERPFKAAKENALKCLDNILDAKKPDVSNESLKFVDEKLLLAEFAKNLVFTYSRSHVSQLTEELLEFFQSSNELIEDDDIALFVNTLCIASNVAYMRASVDGFLGCVAVLCESLTYLIGQVDTKNALKDEKDIHAVHKARQRRRLHSSSDEEEETTVDHDSVVHSADTADSSSELEECPHPDEVIAWPLAVASEWLFRTCAQLTALTKDKSVPVPAALLANVDQLAEIVAEKLNEIYKLLDLTGEDASEETRWILFGPTTGVGIKGAECCRQITFWVAQLTVAEDSPIDFAGYFRRKTGATLKKGTLVRQVDPKEAKKKRRQISQEDTTSSDWLAVYVVFTYDALVNHLSRTRVILKQSRFIPVVPMFVLTKLDKMKSCGPNVRSAMRLIEQSMSRDGMKIVTVGSYSDCCQQMSDSVNEGSTTRSENSVTLLLADEDGSVSSEDTEFVKNNEGMSLYKFADFWKKWNHSS